MNRTRTMAALFVTSSLFACSSGASDSTFAGDSGSSSPNFGDDGDSGDLSFGDAGPASTHDAESAGSASLVAVIRDFKLYAAGDSTTNADFENVPQTDGNGNPNSGYVGPWDDAHIVEDALGADGKPVYKSASTTLTTHGKAAFEQWYRDVAGTNVRVEFPITLSGGGGAAYAFDSEKTGVPLSASDPSKMFFPIDDGSPYATPFGNQGDPHNYSFTVELHTTFTYRGGELFTFRGDDDVFVYINQKLVINLGGIHGPEDAQVNVDALGLTEGQDYPLDFFSAERHKTGSNLLFTTTLGLRPAPIR